MSGVKIRELWSEDEKEGHVTLFRPPRRMVVRLSDGTELIVHTPPGRFGPRIVDEGLARAHGEPQSDTDEGEIVEPGGS